MDIKRMKIQNNFKFEDLHEDNLYEIFKFCDSKTLFNLALVNSDIFDIVNSKIPLLATKGMLEVEKTNRIIKMVEINACNKIRQKEKERLKVGKHEKKNRKALPFVNYMNLFNESDYNSDVYYSGSEMSSDSGSESDNESDDEEIV
jgi:hypothetical protein